MGLAVGAVAIFPCAAGLCSFIVLEVFIVFKIFIDFYRFL